MDICSYYMEKCLLFVLFLYFSPLISSFCCHYYSMIPKMHHNSIVICIIFSCYSIIFIIIFSMFFLHFSISLTFYYLF